MRLERLAEFVERLVSFAFAAAALAFVLGSGRPGLFGRNVDHRGAELLRQGDEIGKRLGLGRPGAGKLAPQLVGGKPGRAAERDCRREPKGAGSGGFYEHVR